MFLSNFSVKKPVVTIVILMMLMAVGLLALTKLKVNEIPDVEMPLLASIMRNPVLIAGVLILVGGLMVSTLPTWSFKNFKVPRAAVLPLLLGVGFYMALLFAEPWGALAMAGIVYLGMLPFSVRSYLRLKQEAESLLEPVLVADNGTGKTAP